MNIINSLYIMFGLAMHGLMLIVIILECDNIPTPTEDAHRYVDPPPGSPLAFKNRMYEEFTEKTVS